MQAEGDFGFVFLEDAGLEHLGRAADFPGRSTLLGRLEHEQHVAAQRSLRLGQRLGHTHENGRVRVVPAGVHDADFFASVARLRHRLERHVGAFGDRQRVHVGAQCDGGPGFAGAQQCHDAGFRDAGLHFETELLQMFGDDPGGAHFAVGKFRVLMKIPSPADDLAVHRLDFGFEIFGVRWGNPERGQCYPR